VLLRRLLQARDICLRAAQGCLQLGHLRKQPRFRRLSELLAAMQRLP
jgi:hypothetical protein